MNESFIYLLFDKTGSVPFGLSVSLLRLPKIAEEGQLLLFALDSGTTDRTGAEAARSRAGIFSGEKEMSLTDVGRTNE